MVRPSSVHAIAEVSWLEPGLIQLIQRTRVRVTNSLGVEGVKTFRTVVFRYELDIVGQGVFLLYGHIVQRPKHDTNQRATPGPEDLCVTQPPLATPQPKVNIQSRCVIHRIKILPEGVVRCCRVRAKSSTNINVAAPPEVSQGHAGATVGGEASARQAGAKKLDQILYTINRPEHSSVKKEAPELSYI